MDRVNELKKAIEDKVDAIKEVPTELKANTQWKQCLEASARNLAVGAFVGRPILRTATVAFGAGVGVGRSYEECDKSFRSMWKKDTSNTNQE